MNIGSLLWVSGIDNTGLRRDASQASQIIGGIGSAADGVKSQLSDMAGALGIAFGAAGLISFGKSVIEVRGQFQQLGIAFETMLGSKSKADKLMNEAVVFAQATPFTLADVATNIKQLMAMGIATDKVMSTMKALGDVAAGVSVPISRVAINYGQVATMGKLQGRELRDFAMAGIPLVAELAKNMKISADEVQNLVTAGQIGFPLVEEAFKTMSSQGGQFYDLMQKQNLSVTGQISNLTDKWQVMLNDIGKSNEGIIYSGIAGSASLITNYKTIGEVLGGLIAVYGVYKVATMAVTATESTRLAVIEAKRAAILSEVAAQEALTAETAKQAAIDQAATTLMLSNEAARTVANTKTIAAKQAASVATAELIALERAYAITVSQVNAQVMAGTVTAAQQQVIIQTELMAVEKARLAAKKASSIAEKAMTAETVLNQNIAAASVVASEAERAAAVQAGVVVQRDALLASQAATAGEIAAARAKGISATAQKILNATMLNNPYVLLAVAVAAVGYAMYKLLTYQTDLQKATTKLNNEIDIEQDKAANLFAQLKYAAEGTKEWKKAKDEILSQYGTYLTEQEKELNNTQLQNEAYIAVTKSIKENIAAKIRDEELQKVSADITPDITRAKAKLVESVTKESGREAGAMAGQQVGIVELIKYEIDPQKRAELVRQFKALGSELEKTAQVKGFSVIGYEVVQINKLLDEYQKRTNEINQAFNVQVKNIESVTIAPQFTNAEKQRVKLRKDLVDAEKELLSLQTKEFQIGKDKDPLTAIADQEAKIKGLKEQLGISTKIKKEETDREKELLDLMKTASGTKLEAYAKEYEALVKIREEHEKIVAIAMFNAKYGSKYDTTTLSTTMTGKTGQLASIYGNDSAKQIAEKEEKQAEKERQNVRDRAAKSIDENNKKAKKIAEEEIERVRRLEEGFQSAADMASMLSDAFADSNKQLSDMLGNLAQISGNIAGAIKGDPASIMAAAMAAAELFSTITNGDFGSDARIKSIERINKLLEEQSRIVEKAARFGQEETARNTDIELLTKKKTQLEQNSKDAAAQLDKLQGRWWNIFSVVGIVTNQKNQAKVKAEIDSINAEIAQVEIDIETAKQELLDFQSQGQTQTVLADAIAQAFQDGKGSVKDFGEYTNDILRDAVLTAFKANILGQALTDAQQQIADAFKTKEGESRPTLTAEEIAAIRASMDKATSEAQTQWDALTSAFPEMFNAAASTADTMTGAISRTITEDTGTELKGLWRRGIDESISQTGILSQSNGYLYQIEINTRRTADNTELLKINTTGRDKG